MSLIFIEVGECLQELKTSLLQMTSFTSNKNFEIYEKLGQVYDHLNWTENYHEEIDEEVLIWLCRFVFPKLLLQGLKLIRLSDFTSQIRQWLLLKLVDRYRNKIIIEGEFRRVDDRNF